MCKVFIEYGVYHGSSACTEGNELAEARGLSLLLVDKPFYNIYMVYI